ncbi:accessory factor UbiK family protein [Cognatazoarcus halotolerans]|uniref:accessory factor UbiK family protein n=1 Tax=Cognatazoarcus halotolerans TaxID=2686016 RepID=UPI00135A3E88|nr:accessory factor UbiK family protein [Cognatazoarcus halotolerans]MCB1901102.1 accessory factor UbiK family protein [Rhodocyclaceae bacterium]MCP5310479.1 accessory factor UbiK family protein [Zoogloeaceae bacterium]
MVGPRLFDEIGNKLSELVANSPAKDLERNVKAVLSSGFNKLDLVTTEDFEIQRDLLLRTREKLEALEQRVAGLEAELAKLRSAGADGLEVD